MKEEIIQNINQGLEAAYINGNLASNLEYKPSFISNNPEEGKKVISSIEEELLRCEKFQISVAFITMGGITPLLQTLKELEKKEIPGEILTTNYLDFSEPRALAKLNELENITLKMYDVESANNGFHTKGYIFKKEEVYRIILGSSNMTRTALTSNIEWNTKIISTEHGEVAKDIVEEFQKLWNSEYALDFDYFYEIYKARYEIIKHQREVAKKDRIPSFEKYTLKPNSMQEEFIVNLRKIMEKGEDVYGCKKCGAEKTESVAALGHGETELRNVRQATCIEDGYTGDLCCKVCGEVVVKGSVIKGVHNLKPEKIEEKDVVENGRKYHVTIWRDRCEICGDRRQYIVFCLQNRQQASQ